MRTLTACLCTLLLVTLAPAARALQFTPTAKEWQVWPEYCRARYVVSAAGKHSNYVHQVPAAMVEQWARTLGAAWNPLHHYCAALAYIGRGKVESDKTVAAFNYQRAIQNLTYTIDRTPQQHPMYLQILIRFAQAHRGLRHHERAALYLRQAVRLFPKSPTPYAALGDHLYKTGQFADARDILLEGNAATDGASAEIHYFLGLTSIALGDYDAALEQAREAYSRGYPLPGLRDKLKSAGRWNE